jgi:hypothetical protein
MMPKPEERPTMNDLAALAKEGMGLECPECSCRHFRVVRTQQGDGVIVRQRECRHCGKRLRTFEGP